MIPFFLLEVFFTTSASTRVLVLVVKGTSSTCSGFYGIQAIPEGLHKVA